MIGFNDTNRISLVADGAYEPNTRVKWSATPGKVTVANNEACIGLLGNRTFKDGDPATVIDIKSPGTLGWVTAGPVAAGNVFASAEGGKVEAYDAEADPAQAEVYGRALTASTGNGQQIEGTSGK